MLSINSVCAKQANNKSRIARIDWHETASFAPPVQGERRVLSVWMYAAPEGPMGAVEHLKTLCCLGLKPESAMIAVTPLLHEIIPHGWSRMGLYESDATMRSAYAENREMVHLQ